LAIGRGGQNVRLAAKLTGWAIDIRSVGGPVEEENAPSEVAEAVESPEEKLVEETLEVAAEESPLEENPAEKEENKEL
jgi:N utilization substance protein A